MKNEVNVKRSTLRDDGMLHIELLDGNSYLYSLQEIADILEELTRLQRVEQAAKALMDGWNKGGITGAPDVVEMQRRMLALAATLAAKEG